MDTKYYIGNKWTRNCLILRGRKVTTTKLFPRKMQVFSSQSSIFGFFRLGHYKLPVSGKRATSGSSLMQIEPRV